MIEKAEEELLKKADIVFTTSSQLLKSRKVLNPRSYYFPNVADHDHFSRALLHGTIVPDDLRVIQPPRIGFIGAISSYKVDFNLIAYVARAHPDWSVVLIGKVGEGDPWTNIENIKNLPNVFILGPRPYTQLPAYLKGIDVAILPNQLNAYTQAMFPMKFFEYLAAGKPIVSVNLPALREYSDMAYLAKSYEDFVLGIEKALNDSVEKRIRRSMIASQYTYKSRTEQMMLIIEKELALESTSKTLESE
jgi:glycosyltransferase involved in cell wall biosynthesis